MSTLPENELDLDKLFLPAWAQEPSSAKQYAQFEGGQERQERRGDRRPGRRDGAPGGPGGPRGNRPGGDRRGPPQRQGDRKPFGREQPGFRRDEPRERYEPPAPLPEINLALVPDERGVESLARQIKTTGRAYPLFDIARLILQKPERYSVTFSVKKKADGQVAQPLFACALDDTLWLSEEEAVAHVLKNHFVTFYQAERTATEPPKGKYTFVAQCGMSGAILGPPNHHDYQNQLRKLHSERFSRIPFDVFKARVKIVRDEEVVKKWVEEQSWKTEFVCLNMPEPLRLANREDVEKHFRDTHKDTIIKRVESFTLDGAAARKLRSPDLSRLIRQVSEDQKRFPLQIATVLSQQFAGHALQFFKVNKTITHVSVARPHYLDLETTPVSEGVKRIVEHINAHPKCNRRKLMEALAPAAMPPAPATTPVAPEPAPAAVPVDGSPVPEAAAAPAPATAELAGPTPEQTAVIADLHWLIHQGHVIEFANGTLETSKKPLPRPPKPEIKRAAPPVEATPAAESSAPAGADAGATASVETEIVPSLPAPESAVAAPADESAADPAAPSESAAQTESSATPPPQNV